MSQLRGKEFKYFKIIDSTILVSIEMCNKRISEDIPLIIPNSTRVW